MCGICGFVSMRNKQSEQVATVKKMMEIQRHRGPDDQGIYAVSKEKCYEYDMGDIQNEEFDKELHTCILGFNRLSIIDVSINGHQPMKNNEGTVVLTFNGEIYNAPQIRTILEEKGYSFRGGSDTEVILNLYLEEGFESMIKQLDGMFSIALLDKRSGYLYLARDRFGIKPLYITEYCGKLYYSSEIKGFLQIEDFPIKINETAVYEHFVYNNLYGKTMLQNVNPVAPGTYWKIDVESGNKDILVYVTINGLTRKTKKQRRKEYLNTLGKELEQSVHAQMQCDVSWGCQLSGGVDSSLIAYYASNDSTHEMQDTVSLVPNDDRYSEAQYIRQVQSITKVNNHEFIYDIEDMIENFENVIWHYETILYHKSALGMYKLCKEAKKYVTVLLSGEGADELFGGYIRYSQLYQWLKKKKRSKQEVDERIVGCKRLKELTKYTKDLFVGVDVNKETDKILSERLEFVNTFTGSAFDKQIKYEMGTFLVALLERQDKMSMASSIETRVPFLGNEVVEFAFTIPEKFLISFRLRTLKYIGQIINKKYDTAGKSLYDGKDLLKRLCAKIYGLDFAYRTKQGMNLPIISYLRDERFSSYINEMVLPKMEDRKIINVTWVKEQLRNIASLNNKERDLLWNAICFEVWCQLFLDKRAVMPIR